MSGTIRFDPDYEGYTAPSHRTRKRQVRSKTPHTRKEEFDLGVNAAQESPDIFRDPDYTFYAQKYACLT